MGMTRWNPEREMVSLRDAIDRLFEDSFIPAAGTAASQLVPRVDLWEKDHEYHACVELPGMKPEDVDVSATPGSLTIKGEFREHEHPERGNLRSERHYGRFERTINFPTEIDPNKIEASFDNGVLNLAIPKSEAVKPRTVKVQTKSTSPMKSASSM
jgi:HSP20 family protein